MTSQMLGHAIFLGTVLRLVELRGITDSSTEIFGRRNINMGYAIAQLVDALRYKPEGRRLDFRLGN